ncbi:MAG: LuxR C-terminal-related transcriptional regulator [Myxococcales bacterium]|jgi:DNA-binding NarL/FixJ family response regulator/tetratricopeptide (TPR) repeat protein
MPDVSEPRAVLQAARQLYAQHAWNRAFEALQRLDEQQPLEADDLEKLAWAAALVGQDDTLLQMLERLYHLRRDDGDTLAAARHAFWLGFRLMALGEVGRGAAWMGRCQALVDEHGEDCVEQGYLLLVPIRKCLASGDSQSAAAMAARATAIGKRFSDPDLVALSRNLEGRSFTQLGRIEEAMALFDESMLAAASGELSPIVTGIIYCAVITCCQQVFALERAREWTEALSQWCEAQPELVTFQGSCQVHRCEILQLAGDWEKALAHAERACCGDLAADRDAVGDAFYMRGEIYRLRGELAAAEQAYLKSSELGRDPQPGLAQLRAAQGRHRLAFKALTRLLAETTDPLARARLLSPFLEICLELGEAADASSAATELDRIASEYESDVLGAISAHARGLCLLSQGDAQGALGPLRRAFYVWQRLDAPYQEARSQLALSRACQALGDSDGARLSLEAARRLFEQLGAAHDLAMLDRTSTTPALSQNLTPRELQVLRLVATGKTNRMIAEQLTLSEKTIDRHVSNIFQKIEVNSRAAATAYAYEHELV